MSIDKYVTCMGWFNVLVPEFIVACVAGYYFSYPEIWKTGNAEIWKYGSSGNQKPKAIPTITHSCIRLGLVFDVETRKR